MKSVKSIIDRRQEIEQQLHAIAMRQPPSQTVRSPDGHLVIQAPFDIQDLKKRVRLKSQLAQIDVELGPAKPVKKMVPSGQARNRSSFSNENDRFNSAKHN